MVYMPRECTLLGQFFGVDLFSRLFKGRFQVFPIYFYSPQLFCCLQKSRRARDQKQETFFFGLMLYIIVLQCQQSFLLLDHVGNPHNPWHMDVWEFLHDYLLDYMLLAEIMGITNMIQANLLDDM